MQARSRAGPADAVVLLTVDSLRADELRGAAARRLAPRLAGLAGRGTTFFDAHATGNWTPFSFPSILGASPVFADGGIGVGPAPSLAEYLSGAGISTAGINAANGFLTPHWGYDRGFESFTDCLEGGLLRSSRYLRPHPTVQAWLGFLATPLRRVASIGAEDRVTVGDASRLRTAERAATDCLRDLEPPFFCWLHLMDCHTPYVPAPEFVRSVAGDATGYVRLLRTHLHTGLGREVGEDALAQLRTLYRAGLAQLDAAVGRLLGVLEERGLRERTAIVVAGDHGEEFQEHGHLAHYPTVYRELTQVPLVVDVPGCPAQEVSRPVSLDSVPPTVCDLLGIQPAAAFEGRSLAPTVTAGKVPSPDPVVSVAVRGETVTQQPIPRSLEDGSLLVGARNDQFTYVHHTAGTDECYDRRVDPTEHDDLLATGLVPAEAEDLRTVAEQHADRLLRPSRNTDDRRDGRRSPRSAPVDDRQQEAADKTDGGASPAVERQLEALGYR